NLGGESMRIDLSPDETVHFERLTVCAVSSPAGEPVAQALLNTARAEGTATLLASRRTVGSKQGGGTLGACGVEQCLRHRLAGRGRHGTHRQSLEMDGLVR